MNKTSKIITGTLFFLLFNHGITYSQLKIQLSESEDVSNPVNYPHFAYYPDGHISVLPDNTGYVMFWAEFESHRSIGKSQFVESQTALQPANAVFGKRGNFNKWDNGGSWLMSVHREQGDNLIGFYHAEDHWYPHTSNDIAWKSIGVTYSTDEGVTWGEGKQIITSPLAKPASPAWGGSGDCCVVWDPFKNRWMCYYQEHNIYMAVSEDPKGAPGTWKKYYNGDFTEPGLGGQQSKLPGLTPGANPSVHWNTYLERWVMVWHAWGTTAETMISFSKDGITWDTPQSIITSKIAAGGKAWYPTIIGETDVTAGQIARIYYADIEKNFSYRVFRARTITFIDPEKTELATARIDLPVDNTKISSQKIEINASVKNIKAAIERAEFYANGELIGKDFSFPYQLNWTPAHKGNYTIKTVFFDVNGTRIDSPEIRFEYDFNVAMNSTQRKNSDLLIYPCPFSNKITLWGMPPGNKEVCVYSINSKPIFCKAFTGEKFEIDLSDLNVGIYFLTVRGFQIRYQKKIVKIE